ncbi:MAG TPA: aminotransferase class IV [Bacteroidales bacterium]|nr:aminotransferase class IV [Bacteroidales bacterium]
MDCYGKYYYLDGLILKTGTGEETPTGERSFYEVIRTSGGIPLFFDDHINRLLQGIETRYNVPANLGKDIASGISVLAERDPVPQINIRVTVAFTGQEHMLHICYIASPYPSEKMYDEGVKVILYHAERFDPGVKLLNLRMRLAINAELEKQNAYEAFLVNKEGLITEGSRSSAFFVTSDGCLYTAPDKMVLPGITRKYIIEICRKEGIRVYFEPVEASQISMFPAVFLTGTSPMVLPVERIENIRFVTSMSLVNKLRGTYEGLVAESIRSYKGHE